MHYPLLAEVVHELGVMLPGSVIERVSQGEANSLVFELRAAGNRSYLLLSVDRALPRLHLLSSKPAGRAAVHPFTLFARSRLPRGIVTGIELINNDRIVRLSVVARRHPYHLYCELTGRSANLVLTDGDGAILSVYYPVPLSERCIRPLLPGLRYEAPPRREQPDPARETNDTSPNRRAEKELDGVRTAERLAARTAHMRAMIKRASDRLQRRHRAQLEDRAHADRADEFRESGELLLSNLNRVQQGTDHLELTGHDGTARTVQLDPALTPVRNAELFFKRYKKARSGRAIVARRIRQTEELIEACSACQARLERSTTQEELDSVEETLTQLDILAPAKAANRRASTGADREPVRRIQFQGWEIIVGRNASGNDYISTRLARPADLWFHADGLPGSHVLVRNPAGKEVPTSVIAHAAGLAAFYSKGRSAGKVPVTFSPFRYVRKPRGAKPGMVTVSRRTTIMAAPHEAQGQAQ